MHRTRLGRTGSVLILVASTTALAWSTSISADAAPRTPRYSVTALAPDADSSAANAINALGVVAGWSIGKGAPEATVWYGSKTVGLGVPEGEQVSLAYGINDWSLVVGNASRATQPGEPGERVEHGFLGIPVLQRPADLPNGRIDTQNTAAAVNNAGTVVGTGTDDGDFSAYVRPLGGAIDYLAPVPGLSKSEGLAINQQGDVAGDGYEFDGSAHAVLWQDGKVVDLSADVAPGRTSRATDVSDTGDVVGTAEGADGTFHGFLWSTGKVLDLGPAGQYDTLKVNNHRQVVFSSSEEPLWQDGQRSSLDDALPADSGWTLQGASDINDAGDIVGTGNRQGSNQAYLLEPSGS